jgi:hypothetical protein
MSRLALGAVFLLALGAVTSCTRPAGRAMLDPGAKVLSASASRPPHWIIIFEDPDFTGKQQECGEPHAFPNMRFNNTDWGDKVSSIIVGPNTWLRVWEDENFKDDYLTFGPGDHVANLGEFNFDNEVDSMVVYDHSPAGPGQ